MFSFFLLNSSQSVGIQHTFFSKKFSYLRIRALIKTFVLYCFLTDRIRKVHRFGIKFGFIQPRSLAHDHQYYLNSDGVGRQLHFDVPEFTNLFVRSLANLLLHKLHDRKVGRRLLPVDQSFQKVAR